LTTLKAAFSALPPSHRQHEVEMDRALIERIVALAEADGDIRAVILEGSIVTGGTVDELSDYDINIYGRDLEQYLDDDRWMVQIGEVLVYQKEHLLFYDELVPSRLVVYRDCPRVDFSFWPLELLSDMVRGQKQYESYRNGYVVLVDKDGLAAQLPRPDGAGFQISPPSRDTFLQELYDFWFEAYCVAKYLSRGDLWYSKLVENGYIKHHLYQIALWHHQAARDWPRDPVLHTEGKRFERWASPELLREIGSCFSGYAVEGTWRSLWAMVELFGRLARQTAQLLDIGYPEQKQQQVINYLRYLESR
jgi:aminoglycoside 6-adenylyltransferase